jgi:MFS family permease
VSGGQGPFIGGLTARLPAVLRDEPQFRLLFAGQALSMLGDRVTFVALPFAVLAAGGDAADVGIVAGATTLPFFLFSLAAGVWADRLDRRRIMIFSDLVRMVCQIVAGALLVSGRAEPWHLAVIALFYGAGDAFFSPAMYGLLPQIVTPAHLQSANAMRGLSMSSGLILGPVLAGALVAVAGPGGALLADAATFGISILCLLRLRPAVAQRDAEPEPDFFAGLKAGWYEVRSRSWVMAMLTGLATYHVVVLPAVFVLGPVLAEREQNGASSWAIIVAGFGIGSVLGDLLMLRWRPARPLLISATFLIVASCQAAILGSGLPVGVIALLEAVTAVCVNGFFTLWETSIQEQIPEHAVSRVGSYDLFVALGLLPLGTAIAGPLSEQIGLHTMMYGMTVIAVVVSLAILAVPSVRNLRRPPSPATAPP